jgi:hypothetical protein
VTGEQATVATEQQPRAACKTIKDLSKSISGSITELHTACGSSLLIAIGSPLFNPLIGLVDIFPFLNLRLAFNDSPTVQLDLIVP